MTIEPVKEKVVLDFKLDKESTQILLEGDIIVPDVKPDMAVILKTDAGVYFDHPEVSQDRVNFVGKLDLQVLYLAKGSEKPVHSMRHINPIDDFFNIEGTTKDMWVDVAGEISHIEYKLLNDRKISFKAVIDVSICVESKNEENIVVDISGLPRTQLLQKMLQINNCVENREERFIVKDDLTIPSGKPNISELLQCDIAIANKDVKVANGKISVNGELIISTLYKGDLDESIIEFTEHEIPFNGAFEVTQARDGMFADLTLAIQDQYIQVRPDADGEDRMIEAEIFIGVIIKVSNQEELQILEDAYCINKNLIFEKRKMKYPKLICRNRNQTPIKEVVQLDDACPNILQIFRVTGKAHLDDIKIIEDKVVVEGIINADVLYIAESDEMPLYCHKTILPFKQIIETRGAQTGMTVTIETSIDHTGFNMLSEREMELRFLLSFYTGVIEEKEMNIIVDVDCVDMEKSVLDNVASMTVYVVQNGDNLWKIAKKYNTSPDELIEINELEDPDKIYLGQKLLILKKIDC